MLSLFLSAPEEPRYGREIIVETGLKSGSLYPILHRLEERGLLDSSWEDFQVAVDLGRRPRRLYRLRAEKIEQAGDVLRKWRKERAGKSRAAVGRELPA